MRLAHACEKHSPLSDQIEIDKSFLGARRVKGKRGPRQDDRLWSNQTPRQGAYADRCRLRSIHAAYDHSS